MAKPAWSFAETLAIMRADGRHGPRPVLRLFRDEQREDRARARARNASATGCWASSMRPRPDATRARCWTAGTGTSRSSRRSVEALAAPAGEARLTPIVGVATHGGRLHASRSAEAAPRGDREAASRSSTDCTSWPRRMPEIAEAARRKGVTITDVRNPAEEAAAALLDGRGAAPAGAPRGGPRDRLRARQAHDDEDAGRGLRGGAGLATEWIYTGQTGWLQGAPFGFVLDAPPERLRHRASSSTRSSSCARELSPELILLEGQSALRNPSGPCGSELVLAGGAKRRRAAARAGPALLRRVRGGWAAHPAGRRGDRADPAAGRAHARRWL